MEPSDDSISNLQWFLLNYVVLTASMLTLSHKGRMQEAFIGDVFDF